MNAQLSSIASLGAFPLESAARPLARRVPQAARAGRQVALQRKSDRSREARSHGNCTDSLIHAGDDAPVMVIFGGNPNRRHEVLSMFRAVGGITAHGALSEEEGMALLRDLPRINLVLIGGRYDEAQRARIRGHVREMLPETPITEPGYDYAYDNDAITAEVTRLLRSQTSPTTTAATTATTTTTTTTKARAAF